ncbi:MAG: AbrB/MazE/SpoVT family DNA-binding domain-containing protein [Burkholderiales bacterium]
MATLKVTKIGNSLGLILPKDVAARLRVGKGDKLSYAETPEGIELSTYDADFQEKLELSRQIARRYRNALRELAK